MKNIINKDELLRKIRSSKNHTTYDSSSYTIIGTYKMPPCKPLHSFIHPGTIIYDSSVNGYFKFIDHVSHLKLASGEEHWILKAFLLYTEDNSLKRQYRDYPKSYYTDNTYIKKYPYIINYKNIRYVSNKKYLELITGVKNLEIEKSDKPITPMRFLLNCLLDSGSFESEGKTYYITRLDETEVKCIEITEDFSIIHHTFNLDNLPINHE